MVAVVEPENKAFPSITSIMAELEREIAAETSVVKLPPTITASEASIAMLTAPDAVNEPLSILKLLEELNEYLVVSESRTFPPFNTQQDSC